jgi:excisionase family DNA binding protein
MTQMQPSHDTDRAPLTLTVPETARLLNIGVNQCYAAVAKGELPSIKVGRRILVSRQKLLDLLNGGGSPDAA